MVDILHDTGFNTSVEYPEIELSKYGKAMNQRALPPPDDKKHGQKIPLYRRLFVNRWTRRKALQAEEYLQIQLEKEKANNSVTRAEARLRDANTDKIKAVAFNVKVTTYDKALKIIDQQISPKDPEKAFEIKLRLTEQLFPGIQGTDGNKSAPDGLALPGGDR